MKNLNKNSTKGIIGVLIVLIVLFIAGKSVHIGSMRNSQLATAIAPNLLSTTNFSVLAALSAASANTTTTTGDLGLSPGIAVSRTGPWAVGGAEYFGTGGISEAAQTDALAVFNDLAEQTSDGTWSLNPSPAPGVWTTASSATFAGPTLTLTGGYDDVWVFQIGSDFTFTGQVVLAGNAQACNVFWEIGRDATIASGSEFIGTLIASRNITLVSGANVNGRIISLNGALTTDNNIISTPTCTSSSETATLHIIKNVINDNDGTAIASNFTLGVSGTTNIYPASFAGSEDGVDVELDAGTYAVTETDGPAGYLESGSGDCSGTIIAGETKICTITNDDISPQLIVNKVVINDSGRNKVISDFSFFIDSDSVVSGASNPTTVGSHTISETPDDGYTTVIGGQCASDGTVSLALGEIKTCTITNDDTTVPSSSSSGSTRRILPPLIDVVKVPSPLALPSGPGSVTYTYTLSNIGIVPVTNITMIDDTCSSVNLLSGDINNNAQLDTNEKWIYSCKTDISKTHTNIVTATGLANGISATDIASATVVVGLPISSPLIHVTKVPSPLALDIQGGVVTYTEKVTNPGGVALSNIRLIDDKCTPMQYISGDVNKDSKLDTNETWIYTCKSNLTKTTTNTATASGEANGITVRDFAIATVILSVPGLPDTGFSSEDLSISSDVLPTSNNNLKLKIPKIGVDANIISVGLTSKGIMDSPKGPSDLGLFNLGPRPGEIGSSVIDGHSGFKNNIPAVFDDLYKLEKGDKIYITDENGVSTSFIVSDIKTYDPKADASDVFISNDDKAHINLITCTGVWDAVSKSHSKRLVVFTDKEI